MNKKGQSLADGIETVTTTANTEPAQSLETASLADKVEKVKTKPKNYVMDLRIHSPASLGYLGIEGIDTAPALVRLAQVKGLDLIAVTDYYSGAFIDRIRQAAQTTNVTVIPGTVLRCAIPGCDDVIISCLFPEEFDTARVQEFLKSLGVPPQAAGDKSYLVKAPFETILKKIDEVDGVALPSRMDKTPSRLSAIPTLVEKYGFRAFDLAYADTVRFFKTRWPKIKFQLFSFSNANALAQVGSRIAKVKMTDPGYSGVKALIARQALDKLSEATSTRR